LSHSVFYEYTPWFVAKANQASTFTFWTKAVMVLALSQPPLDRAITGR